MEVNMKKLFIAAAVVAVYLSALKGADMVLSAMEWDQCWEASIRRDKGSPAEIPEWCFEEGYLER